MHRGLGQTVWLAKQLSLAHRAGLGFCTLLSGSWSWRHGPAPARAAIHAFTSHTSPITSRYSLLFTMDCATLSQSCPTFKQQAWRPGAKQVPASRPFYLHTPHPRSFRSCIALSALALPMPGLAVQSSSAQEQRPDSAVSGNNISPAVSLRRSLSGNLVNTADAVSQARQCAACRYRAVQHSRKLVGCCFKALLQDPPLHTECCQTRHIAPVQILIDVSWL